jgi:AraC-like DNA-binding protein
MSDVKQKQYSLQIKIIMNSPQALNQLTDSLMAFFPNLDISDVMIPQLNGFINQIQPEGETTQYVPLIFFAAKEDISERLQNQKQGQENPFLQAIDFQKLGIHRNDILKPQKESKPTAPVGPNEINPVDQDQIFIEKVTTSIEENMANELYGVDQLAEAVNMSVNNLNRKLNGLMGQTAGKLIRTMRLQKATDLIKQNAGSIAEIAFLTGFSSHSSFNRTFKQAFSVSPTTYRQNLA